MRENSLFERLKGDGIDSVKGLLIILIVLAHNQILCEEFIGLRKLYYFHVSSFLVLGVVLNNTPINLTFVKNRMVRYLMPFFIFLLFYSIVLCFFENIPTKDALVNFGKSIIFAISLAWLLAFVFSKNNHISALILPRNYSSWKQGISYYLDKFKIGA